MYHDIIIIGAGQAGLALGYYLKKQQADFTMLEAAHEIGLSWLNRYDSLKLFTNARYNNLPGFAFPGEETHFPSKDEVASYLKEYARKFELPVILNCIATKLSKRNSLFQIETRHLTYTAKNVIICTGPFQTAFVPSYSEKIDKSILQIHSSEYRNPSQLREGETLVIGAGNSGVQIVEELVNAGKSVYFSFGGKLKPMPNNPLMQWLIFGSGITSASKHSFIGGLLKKRQEPIMGTNLKALFNKPNLTQTGRTLSAEGRQIVCEKMTIEFVENVIWATGFKPDFHWIDIDIADEQGFPI